LAAKPLSKGEKQYSFREFNHDPIQLAAHRDDRIFRSSQIWIQGLPTDPDQAMEIIAHIGNEMKIDILPDSIAQVGELFTALNRNVPNQKLPHYPPPPNASPPMIGSTSNSYATVVNLRSIATFSAVPLNDHVATVTELVIRSSTSSHQEFFTTIVVVPCLIDSTSDLSVILRFHHMGMDAKSELVHAIYQQLSSLPNQHGHPARQIQFIARIITVEKPLWVIDLLAPFGFPNLHINHHFTGNSAGSSETLELDGIPTQVLGGYGITSAPLPSFSHPPLSWANLPITEGVPLRYLAEIATRMGCEGLLSVLYAKADPIRASRNKHDRYSLNQKANTLPAPTFIFRSPRHLKYFLDHFPQFMHDYLPTFMVAHAAVALPAGSTEARYNDGPVHLKTFLAGKSFSLYLSNAPADRHKELAPSKLTADAKAFDYTGAISGLFDSAKRTLPVEQYTALLRVIADRHWPADVGSTLAGFQRIQVSSSRSSTPKRKNDDSETSRLIHQRRITTAAKEQEEASKHLQYSYFTEDDTPDAVGSSQSQSESNGMDTDTSNS
jgi:hypothetical protein